MENNSENPYQSIEEARAADRARAEELQKCGRQIWRATRGWNVVRTQEDWEAVVTQAKEDLDNGQFLLNRLGGEIYLEPEVIATLLILRKEFINVHGVKTPAEYMLVDLALIAYFNALRAQRMLGDLSIHIEHEFFGMDGPRAKLKARYGNHVEGYPVEDMLQRARDQIHVLIERANRMLIRNLRALREVQGGSLVIHADQLNIAREQVNQQVVK